MTPGSVWFDEQFSFHDGEQGEKLFVALGTVNSVAVVVKTTSQQHGRNVVYGCQPNDRFHNFFLPPGCCYLKKASWICLDEFYELNVVEVMNKRFSGRVKPICTLDSAMTRALQDCAMASLDITDAQEQAIRVSLVQGSS